MPQKERDNLDKLSGVSPNEKSKYADLDHPLHYHFIRLYREALESPDILFQNFGGTHFNITNIACLAHENGCYEEFLRMFKDNTLEELLYEQLDKKMGYAPQQKNDALLSGATNTNNTGVFAEKTPQEMSRKI